MRGALAVGVDADSARGIIPAYAGSTLRPGEMVSDARDHPRVCGEHVNRGQQCGQPGGSSPRMRGAPAHSERAVDVPGIIPAYAGSTLGGVFFERDSRDHPRVCGEHYDAIGSENVTGGSSPRMRGAPSRRILDVQGLGIIPAYAGSTSKPSQRRWRLRDHPRVCGEHKISNSLINNSQGSSPRMRGAHVVRVAYHLALGIIPAYAGSTSPACPASSGPWDHPRVCGEHVADSPPYRWIKGSSPRMRGAP